MTAILWFLGSAVLVDLIGYWLHRWSHRPGSPMYRAHMTHHVENYPPRMFFSRSYRSSGRDGLAIYFAPFAVLYVLLVVLSGVPHPMAILAGGAGIALASSVAHDLTHISNSAAWRWRILRGIAVRHHTHHFKMGRNFGILVGAWDTLFRTRRSVRSG